MTLHTLPGTPNACVVMARRDIDRQGREASVFLTRDNISDLETGLEKEALSNQPFLFNFLPSYLSRFPYNIREPQTTTSMSMGRISREDSHVPLNSPSDVDWMICFVEGEVLVGVQVSVAWHYPPLSPRAIAVGASPSLRWAGTTAVGPVRREGVSVAGKRQRQGIKKTHTHDQRFS